MTAHAHPGGVARDSDAKPALGRLRAAAETFALGALALLVVGGAAGGAVVATGIFNVAASRPDSYLFEWAVHTAMILSAKRHAAAAAPRPQTPSQVQSGLQLYQRDCATCHGGPGQSRQPWLIGMNPTPPYLIDAARQWSPAELFWIVKNGVKMTGMPAWGSVRTDDQIWDVVAFLETLPDLSPADYSRMAAPAPVPRPASTGGG